MGGAMGKYASDREGLEKEFNQLRKSLNKRCYKAHTMSTEAMLLLYIDFVESFSYAYRVVHGREAKCTMIGQLMDVYRVINPNNDYNVCKSIKYRRNSLIHTAHLRGIHLQSMVDNRDNDINEIRFYLDNIDEYINNDKFNSNDSLESTNFFNR